MVMHREFAPLFEYKELTTIEFVVSNYYLMPPAFWYITFFAFKDVKNFWFF
jgi:hypothetical protein